VEKVFFTDIIFYWLLELLTEYGRPPDSRF
jgi:hypothetical protein